MSTTSITRQEKAEFLRDGTIIRRGLVPPQLVSRARAMIDDWYQTGMEPERISAYTERTFAPELGSDRDVLALYHESGVGDLVAALIGETQPIAKAQIQIRVPESSAAGNQPAKAMHVDGVACPHLDPAELRTFTLLVGVVLSDVTDPIGGALRYVQGGHLRMADWFRTEWSAGLTDQVPPHIDAEQGTPLLGTPGDVLVMHHLVPHAVGRNATSIPRIMAYFRVAHIRHDEQRLEALRDPWLEFAPLRSITG